MFLRVVVEAQDTRDWMLCFLLESRGCTYYIREEVGRSPLKAF